MMNTETVVSARKPTEENGSARSADWDNPRVASILSAAAKCFARKGFTATTLVKGPGEKDFHHPTSQPLTWPAGTEVLYMTAGGGGWGEPLERDPTRVLRDVQEGYVSTDKARELYGVVLGADDGEVDASATRTLRAQLKQRRAAGERS